MRQALRPLGQFILDAALHHVAAVRRCDACDVSELLRTADPACHADYRVSVAHMLHAALRPDYPGLRAMKLFGSSLTAAAKPSSDIDLVVHVANHKDPIVRGIERLSRELGQAFQAMAPGLPRDFELLDLHFVDDSDVAAGRGYAPVLSGRHEPAMRLGHQPLMPGARRKPSSSLYA